MTAFKAQGKTIPVVHILGNDDPYVPWSRVTKSADLLIVSATPITLEVLNKKPKPVVLEIEKFVATRAAVHERSVAAARALNVPRYVCIWRVICKLRCA